MEENQGTLADSQQCLQDVSEAILNIHQSAHLVEYSCMNKPK